MAMPRNPGAEWRGPRPLENRLTVERLGEIYSGTAAFYDSIVAAKQAAAKLRAIELLARRPGERLLEVGVGTGWALERIVATSGATGAYGLDASIGMLEVARDVFGAAETGQPSLVLGDGRGMPFPDGSFDCQLNTYTFEVMAEADIATMLEDTHRVLRSGGRAVIVNLTDATEGGAEDEAMISDWKARYASDPEFFGGARPLQLTQMVRAHGFAVVERYYVGPVWPSEVLLARKPA